MEGAAFTCGRQNRVINWSVSARSVSAAGQSRLDTMKSGYLYVLVHPSDPDLYKIGVTVLHPEERLAQHNRDFEEYAGQIVKKTASVYSIAAVCMDFRRVLKRSRSLWDIVIERTHLRTLDFIEWPTPFEAWHKTTKATPKGKRVEIFSTR